MNEEKAVNVCQCNHLWFSVFVFLALFAGTLVFSGCNQSQESQTPIQPSSKLKSTTATNMPIEGLFGIRLGEPLPNDCQILSSKIEKGQISVKIIPPQTNAAFEEYSVELNPTNRFVCEIDGIGGGADSKLSRPYLLPALTERYGNDFYKSGDVSYLWKQGSRTLIYMQISDFWSLNCSDSEISEPTKPQVDTKGF